jgi:hypothetical protein
MKCWNSASNAEGSRVIIAVVHVGALKIYNIAAVEALKEKGTTGWNLVYRQNW